MVNTSVGCGCVSATAVPDDRVEGTRQVKYRGEQEQNCKYE